MKNKTKNLLLVVISSLLVAILYAQTRYATTDDGEKVILKPDGTWEYPTSNVSPINQLRSNKSSSNTRTTTARPSRSSSSSAKSYIRGPRGGCYYINSSGGKTYVDRSMCN